VPEQFHPALAIRTVRIGHPDKRPSKPGSAAVTKVNFSGMPCLLALLMLMLMSVSAHAQLRSALQVGAHATLSGTQTNAVAGGGTRRELQLERTMFVASSNALGGHLQLIGSFSLDRAVTDDGVLALGGWGGGFYDRHHPHDYVSEAVVSFGGEVGTGSSRPHVSLSAGKGIVPFGPDNPMDRPALGTPANHDWSQIMERWFGAFAIRGERIAFEAAVFNGGAHGHETPAGIPGEHEAHGECTICDTTPSTTSGAARFTAWPRRWLEFRFSAAALRAPAHHPGAEGTHRMLNLTGSASRSTGLGQLGAMVEVSNVQIDETYRSVLGEIELRNSRVRPYYRVERAERAEGARENRFVAAPEIQEAAVGVTRWIINTLGVGVPVRFGSLLLEPVAEFGVARVSSVGDAPIDIRALYRNRTLWSGLVAVRMMIGTHRPMGRYGVMVRETPTHIH
jgi:hypothetical protein